jgi:hexosaminidase
MTPGPLLHLGGDEALGTARTDYEAFIRRAVSIVAATGKRPVAWHEAGAVTDLPTPIVAQYWGFVSDESDAGASARAVADAGGSVILSPADAIYLDMKPDADAPVGLAWANGPTSVADAYGWDPADIVPGLDESAILGLEAPLWTETVRTAADIDLLAFPRIAAAAEIAWSPRHVAGPAGSRTGESFRERVAALAPQWQAEGIGFHRSPEIPWRDA